MSKLILILTLSILSIGAFAGSTVCSGKNLYYSQVQFDMGMMPPPGHKMGHTTIVFKGKVLVHRELIMDRPGVVPGGLIGPENDYFVNLAYDDTKVLHSDGNPIGGTKVFQTMATLVKSHFPGGEDNAIANELVVCQEQWAMVP